MLKLSFLTIFMSLFAFTFVVNRIDTQTKITEFRQALPIEQKISKPTIKNNIKNVEKSVKPQNSKLKVAKSIKVKRKQKKKIVNINTKDVENLSFIDEKKYNTLDKTIKPVEKRETTFIKLKKNITIQEEEIIKIKAEKKQVKETIFEEAYLNINGKDPIQLGAYKNTKKIKDVELVALLDNIQYPKEQAVKMLAKLEEKSNIKQINNEIKSDDRISTAQAAPEKSSSNKNNNTSKETSMDLAFYDYSNDDENITAESQTNSVKEKIESLKKTAVGIQLTKKLNSNTESWVNSSGVSITNPKANDLLAMHEVRKPEKKKSGSIGPKNETSPDPLDLLNKGKSGFVDETIDEEPEMNSQKAFKSYGSISAFNMTTNKKDKRIYAFDLIYSDEFNTNISSDIDGKVNFNYLINSQSASRRVTINARDMMPTSIDLVLDKGDSSIGIPLVERSYINNLMSIQNLRGMGGFVLIELDSYTEDVELGIDSNFEKKIYLNKNFRSVSREDSDFNYILFAGVEPGNHIVSFKTFKNKITSKIIHVIDEEIYYDYNFYKEVTKDSISFYEEGLLSKSQQVLNITKEEISPINYETNLKMKSFNMIEIKNVILPHATRNYFQLTHLKEKIFVGRSNHKKVVLPSEAYTREAIASFNQRIGKNDCIIQINLPKPTAEVSFNGVSHNRMMVPIMSVLDNDGEFYRDLSNESKRIFILGREQGIINFQIKYTDGSYDFLQSYCSESSYLIEQL